MPDPRSGAQRRHALKRRLCGEQNWRCAYCGRALELATATVDHVIPRARGGPDNWLNKVVACARCNIVKGKRSYLAVLRKEGWSTEQIAVTLETAYSNEEKAKWFSRQLAMAMSRKFFSS